MKATQILMHGRSVRNLLEGRKTQTRRIINPSHATKDGHWPEGCTHMWSWNPWTGGDDPVVCRSPYGQPGDLLYVRESHYLMESGQGVAYAADNDPIPPGGKVDGFTKKRPSIHMPRWASRITLHLTDVRVERVQEISAENARAEGCEPPLKGSELSGVRGDYTADERTSFAILWNDTNGAGAWDRNDWVWVLCFDVIHANVDDALADPAHYGITEAT